MSVRIDNMAMPPYIVYREDPANPNSSPAFFPPKDSDELFDALRQKFPHLKTHSERMRDAIIEFLMEERDTTEQALVAASTAPSATPLTTTDMTSPWQQSWPSMSSGISNLSSPDTADLATPLFGNSPQPHHMSLSRQVSTATSSGSSPPQIENMTSVFSLSTSSQPKQRVRRKMTDAEKVEYRKRRIVKACDKCQRRKRKCVHNQPEMETLPAKSTKVTKPWSSTSSPNDASTMRDVPRNIADQIHFVDTFAMVDPAFSISDEFDYFLEDPLPEISFDDTILFGPEQQFGFGGGKHSAPDFVYQSTQQSSSSSSSPDAVESATGVASATRDDAQQLNNDAAHGHGHDIMAFLDTYQNMNSRSVCAQPQGLATATHGTAPDLAPFATDQLFRFTPEPGSLGRATSAGRMLWEHLRTGQQDTGSRPELEIANAPADPTHTSHVHDVDAQGSFVNAGSTTSPSRSLQVFPEGLEIQDLGVEGDQEQRRLSSPHAASVSNSPAQDGSLQHLLRPTELYALRRRLRAGTLNAGLGQESADLLSTYSTTDTGVPTPLLQVIPGSADSTLCECRREAVILRNSERTAAVSDLERTVIGDATVPVHTRPSKPASSICGSDGLPHDGTDTEGDLRTGRSSRTGWRDVSACVSLVGSALLLSSLLSTDSGARVSSWALLAFAALNAPTGGSSTLHFCSLATRMFTTMWGCIVQCTTENSAWLTRHGLSGCGTSWRLRSKPWWEVLSCTLNNSGISPLPQRDCTRSRVGYDVYGGKGKDKGVKLGWGGIKWMGFHA